MPPRGRLDVVGRKGHQRGETGDGKPLRLVHCAGATTGLL